MARRLSDDEMWTFSNLPETENSSESVDVEVFWRQLAEKRDRRFDLLEGDIWLGPYPLKSPRP